MTGYNFYFYTGIEASRVSTRYKTDHRLLLKQYSTVGVVL